MRPVRGAEGVSKLVSTKGYLWNFLLRSQPGRWNSTTQLTQEIHTTDCSGDQRSDGKTGQTVVGTARSKPGTQSAINRSRRRPANPIRDSGQKPQSKSDVRVQSLPSSHHELKAWHRGRPCTVFCSIAPRNPLLQRIRRADSSLVDAYNRGERWI